MAYLMLNFGMIDAKIDEALDLYFQQCSLEINCLDLAVMAATLSNQGINPCTKVKAVSPTYIRDILSVIYTCGMYKTLLTSGLTRLAYLQKVGLVVGCS
jgi:glutaminase